MYCMELHHYHILINADKKLEWAQKHNKVIKTIFIHIMPVENCYQSSGS
jgi:hypothetical protein